MLKLMSNNRYIVKTEEGYSISSLVVNDDMIVDLDEPLFVSGDMMVSGSIQSNTPIKVDGRIIVIDGIDGVSLNGLGHIEIKGRASLSGSIMSDGAMLLSSSEIGGNVMSGKSVISTGRLKIAGDISAGDRLLVAGSMSVIGRTVVGRSLDIRGALSAGGEVKLMGTKIASYGRITVGTTTIIIADDILITENVHGTITNSLNYRDVIEELKGKKKEDLFPEEIEVLRCSPFLGSLAAKLYSPLLTS